MSSGDRRITLKIDLHNGTIELESSAEDFDNAMERTTSLAKEINLGSQAMPQKVPAVHERLAPTIPQRTPEAERPRTKTKKGSGASSARPGRLGSFEMVDLGLSESQERVLREFMTSKQPTEQREQVAVAMYKGEDILGRKGLTYNEIYTLLRLSGVKELPKALDVVLGAMSSDMWVVKEGGGFAMKFVGRDYVENHIGLANETGK